MTTPIELQVARLIGGRHYFTGKPCKHGHVANRNVVDSSCVACRDMQCIEMRPQRREYARRKLAEAMARDPVGTLALNAARKRALRVKFPERFRASERKHGRLKRQRYPERKLAEVRLRQASKLQRTPQWADRKAMQAFYEARPAGMVVDHVVPLRGRTVSGLHVIENLQYLTNEANLRKNNSFDDWGGL